MHNPNTICPFAFTNIFVRTFQSTDTKNDNNMSPCTISPNIAKVDSSTSLIDQSNTAEFQQLRKNLYNGVRDPNCKICWDAEDKNTLSFRQIMKQNFQHNYPDINLNHIYEKSAENNFNIDELISVEFFPTNICNYTCRMCGSYPSSSWSKLLDINYNYDEDLEMKVFQEIVNNQNLRRLHFTGGETVLQKQIHNMIKWCIDNNIKLKNTKVEYVTNCSTFQPKLIEDLGKIFEGVYVTLSLDGIEETLEYQRKGANWKTVQQVVQKYVDKRSKMNNFYLTVNCVLTAMNIQSIDKFVKYCFENKLCDIMWSSVFQDYLGINACEFDSADLINCLQSINCEQYADDDFYVDTYQHSIDQLVQALHAHQYNPELNKKFKQTIEKQDRLFNVL